MRRFRGWWVAVLLIAAGLGLMWQRPLPGGQPTAPSAAPRSDAVAITQASAPVVSGLPDAEASAPSEESFEVFVTAEGVPVLEARVALARQSPTSLAWRPTWEPSMEKRTDGRGRVEFPASNGNWILGASKDGFATSILDVVKAGGEKVTTVRVSLERGTDLEGLAIDSKDVAIAPALIRAMPLGDRSTRRRGAPLGVVETMVDARGTFRFSGLAAGWWRLEGDAEGAGHADPLLINVPTLEVMKLRFRRSGFLEGVVVRADGGVAPQAVLVVGSGEGTESLLAGATGTFSIERMPGSYRLSATSGGLVGAAEQVALVRAGATTSTRITVSGSGGELVGSVKRDDGVPVAGARVFMSLHNDDGQSGPAITDADGGWRLGGIPRGTYDVEAEAPGLMRTAETGFFVTDGATVRVELVLGRLGRVTGTLESSSGTPMSLRVLLRSLQNAFPERQALADGAGRFSFEDVPPGPAFVTLRRNPERVSRPVDLKVQAGATSDVKVIVVDAVQVELGRRSEHLAHICDARQRARAPRA